MKKLLILLLVLSFGCTEREEPRPLGRVNIYTTNPELKHAEIYQGNVNEGLLFLLEEEPLCSDTWGNEVILEPGTYTFRAIKNGVVLKTADITFTEGGCTAYDF